MKLKKLWLKRYHSGVAKVSSVSPYYAEFKLALRQYLYENQKRNHLPSLKTVFGELPRLMDTAEKITMYGLVDDDRCEGAYILKAIDEMMFTPIVTDHDERGQLDGAWLKVFGILSTDQMSRTEIKYIEDKLGGKEDSNFSAIRITLVSMPITGPIDESKQDKINQAGLDVAKELIFKGSEQFKNLYKANKRGWGCKVKQWILFQTV